MHRILAIENMWTRNACPLYGLHMTITRSYTQPPLQSLLDSIGMDVYLL